MRCAIWYHLHNLKNVKNTHGGVLLLSKLQTCNFTKSSTPPCVLFAFSKLYKWYQIAQSITIVPIMSSKEKIMSSIFSQMCSAQKLFWKKLPNSQQNTCIGTWKYITKPYICPILIKYWLLFRSFNTNPLRGGHLQPVCETNSAYGKFIFSH